MFHGSRPPNLSTRQYVERIAAFSGCSPCCLIIGSKYLEDLALHDSAFLIDSFNGHRLILTSIMIAAKFLDDFYYSNGYWAKVGLQSCAPLEHNHVKFSFFLAGWWHSRCRAEWFGNGIFVSDEIQSTYQKIGLRRVPGDLA